MNGLRRWALPLILPLLALALWWVGTGELFGASPMAKRFSPQETLLAAQALLDNRELLTHSAESLRRVGIGLLLALLIGVPVGLLVGVSADFERGTTPSFQFMRMVSPLSLMPLAVMLLGIGDAPVYFLLAFAAVWPIILSVASGVAAIDPRWLRLAHSLSANRYEILRSIILPAIVSHLLVGVRLAIGLVWIVLVPAEMLGVQAGLGYFILDTRDRLAYGELMVAILYIGLLGYLLDSGARWLHRRWSHRR